MAGLGNMVLSEVNTIYKNLKMQTSYDDLFPFLFHMDHPDKITFWTITSNLWTNSHQTLTVCRSTQGTDSMYVADFEIHR